VEILEGLKLSHYNFCVPSNISLTFQTHREKKVLIRRSLRLGAGDRGRHKVVTKKQGKMGNK
jgi:hypothetical protein